MRKQDTCLGFGRCAGSDGTHAAAQDAAAIGEEVYEQHCQSCHGEKLRSAGAMPDLRELGENDRAKFDTMVMEGRGQMPAWQGIVSPGARPALGLCPQPRALVIQHRMSRACEAPRLGPLCGVDEPRRCK